MVPVVDLLCQDQPLPARMREGHLQPDLLLIYFKQADDMLVLVRLGSHSELF